MNAQQIDGNERPKAKGFSIKEMVLAMQLMASVQRRRSEEMTPAGHDLLVADFKRLEGVAVALLLWELVSLLHRWSLGSPVRSLIGEAVWALCLAFLCTGIAMGLWVLIRILGAL